MPKSASKLNVKAQREIQKHIDHDHGFYCARVDKDGKKKEVGVSTVESLVEVTIGKMEEKEGVKKIEKGGSTKKEKPTTGSIDSMSATPIKDRLKAKAEKRKDDQQHHNRCCLANQKMSHNPSWHADCCPLNEGSKKGMAPCAPTPLPRTILGPLDSRITLQPMPPSKPVATSPPSPAPNPTPTPTPLQKRKSTQAEAPKNKEMEEELKKMRGLVEKLKKEDEKKETAMKLQTKIYEKAKEEYNEAISSADNRYQAIKNQFKDLVQHVAGMEEKIHNNNLALKKMEEERDVLKNELLVSNQDVGNGKELIFQQEQNIALLHQQLESANLRESESAKALGKQQEEILDLKNKLAISTISGEGSRDLMESTNALLRIKIEEVETLKKELHLKTLWVQSSECNSVEMVQKEVQKLHLRNNADPQSGMMEGMARGKMKGASLLPISTTDIHDPLQALNRWAQSSLVDSPRTGPTTESAEHWNQPPPSILAPISLTGGGSESSGSAPRDLTPFSTSIANSTWIQHPIAMFSTALSSLEATSSNPTVHSQFPALSVHGSPLSNAAQLDQPPSQQGANWENLRRM